MAKTDVEQLPCEIGGPHRLHARPTRQVGARAMFENWCWKCGIPQVEILRQYAIDPETPASIMIWKGQSVGDEG